MNDISREPLRIRPGGADDIPAVIGLFDRAVEWLVARGRTGQWGTKPWSAHPKAVASNGFERTVPFTVADRGSGDYWPGQALAGRV
jgi:hypothetical protein